MDDAQGSEPPPSEKPVKDKGKEREASEGSSSKRELQTSPTRVEPAPKRTRTVERPVERRFGHLEVEEDSPIDPKVFPEVRNAVSAFPSR